MKTLTYIILLLTLSSCYCTYDITVNKDGSAHILIYDWTQHKGEKIEESVGGETYYTAFDAFKNDPIISNYKRSEQKGFYKVEYDIQTVDSIHRYLFPMNEEDRDSMNVKFKHTEKQFMITNVLEQSGPDEATMYAGSNPFKMIFRFNDKIKSLSTDLNFVKQINKKEIEINSDLDEISYGKGTQKITISF